ncbi:MAG: methyltransferase domain-containing protein [Clostridia bacterium]|nr:methyltransferase domain-containing protein [Clostridia bacterium]MBP3651794.1 methyltransferase domain-containing protein [Clostridia bacterium]
MANDFRSARFWAAELIESALFEGAHAVDATLGNGHDALWLCGLVGETGHVYGFDVQAEAVERSRARLAEAGVENRADLILDGHQNMRSYVDAQSADVVMFNLGWLPGAAHGVTTQTATTLQAVNAALEVLKEEGLLTICIYPGHEEGAREREALLDWAKNLDEREYDTMLRCYLNQSGDPPLLIAVKKNKRRCRK